MPGFPKKEIKKKVMENTGQAGTFHNLRREVNMPSDASDFFLYFMGYLLIS